MGIIMLVNGIYIGKYIGQNGLMGFQKNKTYALKIDKQDDQCYKIIELQDDLYLELSSEISIRKYFDKLKLEE